MKRPPLPAEIVEGVEEITGATRALMNAARNLDPDALVNALQIRAAAINAIEPAVADYRRKAGASADEALGAAGAQLEKKAEEAREALYSLMTQIKNAVDKLNRESSAIRSYTANESPGSLLRRSG